ncbi:hypothetical protein TVAG_127170 [Trichomonas vaginalis G3]|uniref:Uncharacterized protein n=1 Tax=Trichomonas vaginalis (strain ATCC PRA-98 / G3) TaxID=412133 RepID=A2E7Y5_TRIV3|nr:hypothetical protein TVAGG3_0213640 [Trichomonas vaginalis G3]EAY11211.1 hypothetical protein TVAG_127170 [Trichomonas vaginalis G3]KAI5551409.1 hypothetical protein TVAGG3_0213640 [Trichomonas vaginalis G3]|eukprot:XP_001323434.1 hypothetical protein [Trichomonas vaginalis G3]
MILKFLKTFIRTTFIYIVTMFSPYYLLTFFELVIFAFTFSDKTKFNDFYDFLLELHTQMTPIIVLFFLLFPFLQNIFKFRVVPKTGYRKQKFNVPNRAIALICLVSIYSFKKYMYFSIGLSICGTIVYYFDEQSDLPEIAFTFALELLMFFLSKILQNYFRIAFLVPSIVLSLAFLFIKRFQLLLTPNDFTEFIVTLFQQFGVLLFEIVVSYGPRRHGITGFLALFLHYAIYVASFYVKSSIHYPAQTKKE